MKINNKLFVIVFNFLILIIFIQSAWAQEAMFKKGEFLLENKEKTCEIAQYQAIPTASRFYSLQCYKEDYETNVDHDGLMLVMDNKGSVIQEMTGDVYAPEFILYDINEDIYKDLILLWPAGAHSTYAEVWLNQKGEKFEKVFEEFNDKNVMFEIRDGIPRLLFKKEYPMSVSHNNFPDKDWDVYKWNGKTFTR